MPRHRRLGHGAIAYIAGWPVRHQFSIDTDSQVSDQIGPGFFGGNFLVGRDNLGGTFADKADLLGLDLLRYPGGAIAEDHFDITNPDAPLPGLDGHHTGLTEFLNFCALTGRIPAIVIPTKKYSADLPAGLEEVRAFATRLNAGEFGPIDNLVIQIGNEFYADNAQYAAISDNRYGEIASQMAVVVHDTLDDPPVISVQIGRRLPETNRIMDHFDSDAEKDAVTALTVHQYPWTLDAVDARMEKTEARIAEWTAHLGDPKVFLSEWNIGSSPDSSLDDRHDYGLAQNPALLEIVFEAVSAGVDYAAIWGVQQRSKTALTGDEGEDDIWAAGHLFGMMSESLVGAHALAQPVDLLGDQSVIAYAFERDADITVFVAARDVDLTDGPVIVDVDLFGMDALYSAVSADRISTTTIGNHPKPRGVLTDFTPDLILEDETLAARVSFNRDHEVIRLSFTKADMPVGDGVRIGGGQDDILSGGLGDDMIKGHTGTDILIARDGDDDVRGGQGGDQIDGGDGADQVKGGSGADRLIGGAGDDRITGNAGRDHIFGGQGDDQIDGGVGRDLIHGGSGADRMDGGGDNDRFWGGDGADTFVFGANFGFDRIYDFADGIDLIDLSGIASVTGFEDLEPHLTQTHRHSVITLAEGTLVLNKTDLADLSAADFIF